MTVHAHSGPLHVLPSSIVLPLYYQVLASDQGGTVLHFRFPQHGALDGDVQLTLSCLLIFRVALYQHMYPHVLLTYLFKKYIIYWFCVCVVRGQLWGLGSLFSPCRAQVFNSDYQAWHQAPWSAEPFHGPLSFYKLVSRVDRLQKSCLFYNHHFPALGAGQTPPRKVTKMARGGGGVCVKKIA